MPSRRNERLLRNVPLEEPLYYMAERILRLAMNSAPRKRLEALPPLTHAVLNKEFRDER